jgi:hypothetical protein
MKIKSQLFFETFFLQNLKTSVLRSHPTLRSIESRQKKARFTFIFATNTSICVQKVTVILTFFHISRDANSLKVS